MFDKNLTLKDFDPELFEAIKKEDLRQEEHIELIASENYTSPLVMQVQGSGLTNKYAEGYPGKRYYGGCEFVDTVESLAIERAKELFKCDFANVQPHSGSQANFAVYTALLKPGDTVLGMDLTQGGHLTHGAKINFSGQIFNSVLYGINEQGLIDYENVRQLAIEHKPKMIMAGFSAYSQIIDWKIMREIADEVGAYLVVDMAHIAGLVATDLYPSPLPYAHFVTSTTHKTLAGPRGGLILSDAKDEKLYKALQMAVFPYSQGGPLMHIIAAKAVCFKEALKPEFKIYQQNVIENAKAMANVFIERGYQVVSNGTCNHLLLVSLIGKNITGKQAEDVFGKANITINKNMVPNDPNSPFVTSGIRIGTPAVTRRGFDVKVCSELAHWICDLLEAISSKEEQQKISSLKDRVIALCKQYPVYL